MSEELFERTRAMWAMPYVHGPGQRDGLPWQWGKANVRWPDRLASRGLWRLAGKDWTMEQRLVLFGEAVRQATRKHWAPLHEWRVWHRAHPASRLDSAGALLMWREMLRAAFPAYIPPAATAPSSMSVYCMPMQWQWKGPKDGRCDWPDAIRIVWDHVLHRLGPDVTQAVAKEQWLSGQEQCWVLFAKTQDLRRSALKNREAEDPAQGLRKALIESLYLQAHLGGEGLNAPKRGRL